MTPIEKAMVAYHEDMAERLADDQAVERAISVYLTALSEDEATVEKVARQLCPMDADSTHEMVIGNRWYQPHLPHWHSWVPDAKAALKILAAKEPT